MKKNIHEDDARQVIKVVDKIVADNDSIIAVCNRARAYAEKTSDERKRERRTVQFIIMHYSNLTAVGGGLTALPGMLPFVGPIFSIFGAGACDAVLALKYELEMTLALSHFAGFDIADARERKLAFLLACASLEEAYDSEVEPSLLSIIDLAMGEFSTRELSKSLVKMMVRVIVMMTSKKLLRYFPVIGVAVGASVNKVLSMHTGYECWRTLKRRRSMTKNSNADSCGKNEKKDGSGMAGKDGKNNP